MTVGGEWEKVDEALERLQRHRKLRPTVAALRKVVDLVKHDPALADVRPQVSLASLIFSRGMARRGVYVGWNEDVGYEVAFVDPPLEFSEGSRVREDAVARVLREHLDQLAAGPTPP